MRKPSTPVTRRCESSTIVVKAYSGMNCPWQSGQERPHPSAEPVFVTVAPMTSTTNMPIVAATANHFATRSMGGSVDEGGSESRSRAAEGSRRRVVSRQSSVVSRESDSDLLDHHLGLLEQV